MFKLVLLFVVFSYVQADTCPNGAEIYDRGISNEGKSVVLDAHNNYRLQIANGSFTGQPRGINLKRMKYDDVLGDKGKPVSDTCKMEHIIPKDSRWSAVGQNLYISWSSSKSIYQDWNKAVTKWFNEQQYFVYPTTSYGETGHYTQVVWADTEFVGCDFIAFYDTNQPKYPHAKLYTCNYGPAGNYKNTAPYKTGNSGCENLC